MKERAMFDTPKILFEDNHLLVALKEPNLLVQGDSTGDPDMLNLLKDYIKEKYKKPGDAYLGLVHRMDRPVGGLLCFAKTSKAAERLSRQIQDGRLKREYVAVVEGMAKETETLRDILEKDKENNMVRVVPSYLHRGKHAVLHYRCNAFKEGQSLVTIQLETGRAHQIRVQMANAGLPLYGDMRYGAGVKGRPIALFGMRLSLLHPITGQQMVFLCAPGASGVWLNWRKELDGLQAIWPEISALQ